MDKIKRYFKPDQISQMRDRRDQPDLVVDDVDDSELTHGDDKRIEYENTPRADNKIPMHPFPAVATPSRLKEDLKSSRESKSQPNLVMGAKPFVRPSSSRIVNLSQASLQEDRGESGRNVRKESSEMPNVNLNNPMSKSDNFTIMPLNAETTKKLRLLLFGNTTQLFNDEWRKQTIKFSDLKNQSYALLQTDQGPSGFLSSIQAYIVIQILSTYEPKNFPTSFSSKERTSLLASAITKMLLKCANGGKLFLAILNTKVPVSLMNLNKSDCVENLDILEFDRGEYLQEYLSENVHLFESKMISASILILISAILTRDIDRLAKDMDQPSNTLLKPDGQCSNELLNLVMQGRAVSNFFNDSDSTNLTGGMSKKGPKERNEIGFLSCIDKIGSYYMTPKWPVWLVRLDTHVGLVFSLKKEILNDWKAECVFNMFFIELVKIKPEHLVRRLTIYNRQFEVQVTNLDDSTPPVESVLLTKWKGATIEWI